tara:strand:- start:2093 stop:2275 length:183 start_codon:yes stop_codon:yes gene_type:complete
LVSSERWANSSFAVDTFGFLPEMRHFGDQLAEKESTARNTRRAAAHVTSDREIRSLVCAD